MHTSKQCGTQEKFVSRCSLQSKKELLIWMLCVPFVVSALKLEGKFFFFYKGTLRITVFDLAGNHDEIHFT
jgi:hypothetical protein